MHNPFHYLYSLREGAIGDIGEPSMRKTSDNSFKGSQDLENPSSFARLIIADDHELVRESMRSMLQGQPDLRIVGEAKDGQETIELTRLQRPNLVLMDVRMPKVNGCEATRTIKEEFPTTKVLIVSGYEVPRLVSEALRSGADGYVLKLSPLQELLDAIRGVLRGEPQYP